MSLQEFEKQMILQTLFPDCQILTMPQRSEAWFNERMGRLTASQIGPWICEKGSNKRALEARHNAANKLLAQERGEHEASGIPQFDIGDPPPTNPFHYAIWNGVQREPEARELFEEMFLFKVHEVGFCRHKSGIAGCSPDGLIEDGNGLEIKCPKLETHIGYLEDDKLPAKYEQQVQFSMAVTGAKGWWFMSYHHLEPPLTVYVERNEKTEEMVEGIERFHEFYKQRKESLEATEKAFQQMMEQ